MEARRRILQHGDGVGEFVGNATEFLSRGRGLLRAGGHLNHRLLDLGNAFRLARHAGAHIGETRERRVDGNHDPAELAGDFLDLASSLLHFHGKSRHFVDARGDRRLHLSDDALDVERCAASLIGESPNFARNNEEAKTCVARLLRLNRGVHRKQIGLFGDFADRDHDRRNRRRLLRDHLQTIGDVLGRAIEVRHG